MLSEEEIEKAKECLKETIQNTYAEGKATKLNNALKYIKQLESDKQKIIEKLEECAISYYTLNDDEEYVRNKDIEEFSKEILSILKGENQVIVK